MIGNRLTMRKNLKIIVLLVLTMTKMTVGDMFSNTLTREDPCVSLCEKTPVTFTDVCIDFIEELKSILYIIYIYCTFAEYNSVYFILLLG